MLVLADLRLYSTKIYIFLPLMALSWTSLLYGLVRGSLLGRKDVGSGNVQDEGSVGGDEAREATVTVGVVLSLIHI